MDRGYSICFNVWALDNEIKNELRLLLILSSLCAEKGYCWASNEYLAKLFDETPQSISHKIRKLESKGYIEIEYKKNGSAITNRAIAIKKLLYGPLKKNLTAVKKIFKDNNISNNNTIITSNNSIGGQTPNKKFIKPTLEEVMNYCLERKNGLNAEKFIDYYESNGWKVGKNPMKDWKATIRNWERKEGIESKSSESTYEYEFVDTGKGGLKLC